jgi:hypothetical protein
VVSSEVSDAPAAAAAVLALDDVDGIASDITPDEVLPAADTDEEPQPVTAIPAAITMPRAIPIYFFFMIEIRLSETRAVFMYIGMKRTVVLEKMVTGRP